MKCPFCNQDRTHVVDSRSADEQNAIRRRRVCEDCGRRFTTYEEILRDELLVAKRDGRLEEFSRAKLENGILRSCLKRPISRRKIDYIVDGIIEALEAKYEAEIPAKAIGDAVMDELLKLDEVAYIRFASVYRNFTDVNQFLSAITDMVKKR